MKSNIRARFILCATIFLAGGVVPCRAYAQDSSPKPAGNTPCPASPAANLPVASPPAAISTPVQIPKSKPNIPPGARAHSFDLHIDSGWAFHLPGAQAAVITPTGAAFSPIKTIHVAPSAGVTFWITRWVGAYADVVGIDGGSASAGIDGIGAEETVNFTGSYFGTQFQFPKGWIRPYADVGGGVFHVSANGNAIGVAEQGSANLGSIRAGGGVRFMCSKRWGVKFSAEAYHFSGSGISGNFPRIGAGWFFQTKPSGDGRSN